MTEHLPECLHDDRTYGLHGLCICDEIKRAEKRVLDALDLASANVKYQSIGFAAGLDAARDAVDALPKWISNFAGGGEITDARLLVVNRDQALAAIDALREEQK